MNEETAASASSGPVEETEAPADWRVRIALNRIATGLVELVRELAIARDETTGLQTSISLETPMSNIDHADWVASINMWLERGRTLIADLPDRPCPACAGGEHRHVLESYDGYPFHECNACGTWFVPKRVDGSLFQRYFETCPEAKQLAQRIVRTRLTSDRTEQDVLRIRAYLEDVAPYVDATEGPRTYLDIGCSIGHSLITAAEEGYRVHGIEVDDEALAIARERGLSVGTPSDERPLSHFKLISLWETIEHIAAPDDVLATWQPALARGGVLALTFPNLNAPPVRLLRNECSWVFGGVTTPGHLNLFSVKGIRTLLERHGLHLLDADAQFGMNRLELVLFALGTHGGVRDLLRGSAQHNLSEMAVRLDNAIGPALALTERLLLLSPILRIVACRTEDRDLLTPIAEDIRARRAEAVAADAESLLPGIRAMLPTDPATAEVVYPGEVGAAPTG